MNIEQEKRIVKRLDGILNVLVNIYDLMVDVEANGLNAPVVDAIEIKGTLEETTPDVSKDFDTAKGKQDTVIKMMRKLRGKGGTYKEISAHLNMKGIPTFSGDGEWWPQSVHRLLKPLKVSRLKRGRKVLGPKVDGLLREKQI